MTEVEDHIYQYEGNQREVLLFFHQLLTGELDLTAKITFGNPCYYKHSWICYLKPDKAGAVELAFMRGNELSNAQGLLESRGRKQLCSVLLSDVSSAPLDTIREVLHEAILLDESTPYESKRKKKG